jgi:hypothetical protein
MTLTKDNNDEVFYGSIMILIPEEVYLAGNELTNEYKTRLFDLFDECTQRSDFIANNTDDYKFLHAMEDTHPEWFSGDHKVNMEKLFKQYEDSGYLVDRATNSVTIVSKLFKFFTLKKTTRLVRYNANAKISKKLMMHSDNFMLLYYMSFILCSVFSSAMIKSIVAGNITLQEMFESPWIRNTYKAQFSKLMKQIESTPATT